MPIRQFANMKFILSKKFIVFVFIGLLLGAPVLIIVGAQSEQRAYLAKALPILKAISSPDDSRLKTLERQDSLGFTSELTTTKLKDGWVVILQRLYVSDEDSPFLRQFFEHRIIAFRDSKGRVYVKAQGILPPPDVNNKGEADFEPSENISVEEFFERERNSLQTGWVFWEAKSK